MGVIDLDARVKKLEQGGGGGADPGVIDQLEAAVTDLEETVNGNGETDFGLVGDVAALNEQINGDGDTDLGMVGDIADLQQDVEDLQQAIAPVPVKTSVTTLSHGSPVTAYGGVYYEKYGYIVHVHLAVSGLTNGSNNEIFTLPAGYRPDNVMYTAGMGNSTNFAVGQMSVWTDGKVFFNPTGTEAYCDIMYMLPAPAATT